MSVIRGCFEAKIEAKISYLKAIKLVCVSFNAVYDMILIIKVCLGAMAFFVIILRGVSISLCHTILAPFFLS